jgi:Na+-translocating ferredoxin:NAD+ oxidoreductase RnfE subunit
MGSGIPPKASVREKVTHEFREFVVIAIYLFIFFTALSYFKATSLHAYGIDYAPFGLAAIKALIFAKFILIGRALHAGERFKSLPLIWPTLYKSLAFVVVLAVLDVIEEVVVGLIHQRTIWDSIVNIGGGTIDQAFATSIIVLLILIPFFAFQELGEIVGERNLVQLFFTHRHRPQS